VGRIRVGCSSWSGRYGGRAINLCADRATLEPDNKETARTEPSCGNTQHGYLSLNPLHFFYYKSYLFQICFPLEMSGVWPPKVFLRRNTTSALEIFFWKLGQGCVDRVKMIEKFTWNFKFFYFCKKRDSSSSNSSKLSKQSTSFFKSIVLEYKHKIDLNV